MRIGVTAGVLLMGLGGFQGRSEEPNLMSEVAAVRAEIARSMASLRQYTWTENIEVRVNGSIKSSSDLLCRYDSSGEFKRTPIGTPKNDDPANAVSKRPSVRANADMQDYIERAITLMYQYVPPKPEEIDYLLNKGYASFGKSEPGKSAVEFKNYFQQGDLMTFIYDSRSKVLLEATVQSALGKKKDPVTMKANFEALPDGVNHFASGILEARKRGVQVKMQNHDYRRVSQ
jgi:hypothetical protein